ncbi:MAG: tripartite tricarboxylate transporter TctB family protein [Deltaproteobacteria bacterium]|nr:tripartite tricarboxylate transporter TctB family protein [Deltaproteobacteria bacterium]
MKTDEITGGVVLLVFGLATVLLSSRMPIGTFRMAGTGLFPLILGISLAFLSGLFLLQLFLKKQSTGEKSGADEIPGVAKQWVIFFGTTVLITLFFNQLGYLLSSFALMAALLRTLGVKRWKHNLPLSFTTAIVCYVLFVQFLKIPLPKGWIGI